MCFAVGLTALLTAAIELPPIVRMGAAAESWVHELLEVTYRFEPSVEAWSSGIVRCLRPVLGQELGLTCTAFDHREGRLHLTALVHSEDLVAPLRKIFKAGAEHLADDEREVAFGPQPTPIQSATQLMRRLHPRLRSLAELRTFDAIRAAGANDFLTAAGVDAAGLGYALAAPTRRTPRVSRASVARWSRLRAHLLAGLRLHANAELAQVDAVMAPDGRVLDAAPDAAGSRTRALLRAAAVRLDRARAGTRVTDGDELLGLWQGLIDGRWSLVDQFDSDGRRFVVARRNDPALTSPRGLSLRERQVVAYALLGRSNKEIAYELGLSSSTVSTQLGSAMRKIGVRGRGALARLVPLTQLFGEARADEG